MDKSIDNVLSNFRAAAAKQEDLFTLTALAHLLADLGQNDEAALYFEKALQCPHLAPKDGSSSRDSETRGLAMGWYASLIEADGSEGEVKAEGLYKAALRANERDPLAMGNYAVFLHRIKRDHRVSKCGRRRTSKTSVVCTLAEGICLSTLSVFTRNDRSTRTARRVQQQERTGLSL